MKTFYSFAHVINEQAQEASSSGFVIPFAFPEYSPKIDDPKSLGSKILSWIGRGLTSGGDTSTYGKLGHGGIGIVNSNGSVRMFEFGRYPGHKEGYGITRMRSSKVPAIIKDGEITNLEQVVKGIKAVTYPPGPSMQMKYVAIKAPNVKGALDFAKQTVKVPMEYDITDFSIASDENDANCGTFALQTVKAAGVKIPDFCFAWPTAMITELSPFGTSGTL